MALGFGEKKIPMVEIPTASEKTGLPDPMRRDPAIETGVYGYDVERPGPRERKMSRIAGPGSDNDSAISVGKQIELEATSSIKYRTCSWPKVNSHFRFSVFCDWRFGDLSGCEGQARNRG